MRVKQLGWMIAATVLAGAAFADGPKPMDEFHPTVSGGEVMRVSYHNPAILKTVDWLKACESEVVAVEFNLKPSAESEIHCRLLLPPRGKWNGRFWGVGNCGLGDNCGPMNKLMLPHVRSGAAACIADMGTANGRHGREVIRDFGWRAAHLMTVEAKKMVAAYYGKPAAYNYFYGLSSGGGQGLHEAQRFPGDYDGIVCYMPAHYRTGGIHSLRHLNRMAHDADGKPVITAEQCRAVARAAIDWFAPNEPPYAAGKFITALPVYSRTAAEGILDLAAKKVPVLKDEDLRRRWIAIWEGCGKGNSVGTVFGADISRMLERKNFMNGILCGKGAKESESMTDGEVEALVGEIAADVDAGNPDLSKFAARGGKLMMVSGLADSIVSPRSALRYCEAVAERMGADQLDGFFRAYFLPGRDHVRRATWCDGLEDIPSVEALVDWCEMGVAPGALTGTLGDGTKVQVAPWPLKVVGSSGHWATAPMGCSAREYNGKQVNNEESNR